MSDKSKNENNRKTIFDFFASPSSSKGTNDDPLRKQYQREGNRLSKKEIRAIYKQNRIAQNIIDIPAEDSTREWIYFEDTSEDDDILEKLNDLDAKHEFEKLHEYERLTGDGFISIGVANQMEELDIKQPLNPKQLKDIEYIHAFSRNRIKDANVNEDPFNIKYGEFELYELEPLDYNDSSNEQSMVNREVHASRVLHLQMRSVEGEMWGIPLMESIHDPLLVFDNFAWSMGQLAYSLIFKVLKTNQIDFMDKDKYQNTRDWLESDFNTNTLAMIGKEDELNFVGPGGKLPNLKALIKFIWDYLAAAARIPKSHIMGQQAGTISGAQYDSLNYYMRIAGLQENYIRPLIEQLIDLLYAASDSGVGSGSILEPQYKMKFNPLWRLDKKTDAEIRQIESKIHEKYNKMGAISGEEIRKIVYGENPIEDVFDLDNITEDEIEHLANIVDQARRRYYEKNKNNKE